MKSKKQKATQDEDAVLQNIKTRPTRPINNTNGFWVFTSAIVNDYAISQLIRISRIEHFHQSQHYDQSTIICDGTVIGEYGVNIGDVNLKESQNQVFF